MPYHQYCVNLYLLINTDTNMAKQLWNEKLGRCDFTLSFIFLLNVGSSSMDHGHFSSESFSNMQNFINRMRDFVSWIIWGQAGGSSTFLSRSIDLAFILFKHDQYVAAEVIYLPLLFFLEWNFGTFSLLLYFVVIFTESILYFNLQMFQKQLLMMAEAHLLKEKTSQSIQDADGGWCMRHHLLGCCLLAQVQCGLHATQKDKKVSDAIRCFFRYNNSLLYFFYYLHYVDLPYSTMHFFLHFQPKMIT